MITARLTSPLFHAARSHQSHVIQPLLRRQPLCSLTKTSTPQSKSFLNSYRLSLALALPVVAVGSSLLGSPREELRCESDRSYAQPARVVGPPAVPGPPPTPPQSILNPAELGFGTVAGICVGVFVKKGLKMVAFTLGGVFVLMQYFSSRSLITINWSALTSSYDSFITKRSGVAAGGNRAAGLWSWFIDFVSADIQGRATFVAGLVLGLRVG